MSDLTCSSEGIPANPSPSPDGGKESTTSGIFGHTCSRPFANYDHGSQSWRTSQVTFLWASDEYSEIWPRAGTTASGTAYQRQPLAPLTKGTVSSSWPTPTTSDYKGAASVDSVKEWDKRGHNLPEAAQLAAANRWPTPTTRPDHPNEGNIRIFREKIMAGLMTEEEASAMLAGGRSVWDAKGKIPALWPTPTARLGTPRGAMPDRYKNPARSSELDDAVAWVEREMFPTPKARRSGPDYNRENRKRSGGDDLETTIVKQARSQRIWPTPTTQDAANDAGPSQWRRNSLPLNTAVKEDRESPGQLNPDWVEALMGFPPGWTRLR